MYKATTSTSFVRLADGACIPADPANVDYQGLLSWIEAGNTPEPADAPLPPNPLQKIADIEAANPVTHRMLRELTLSVAQIASAVTGRAPEENKAVRDIHALEAEIAKLREQARLEGLIP
jgi:hypothetical protein